MLFSLKQEALASVGGGTFTESNKQAYYDQLAEDVREETRLEELRKTRKVIEQNQ